MPCVRNKLKIRLRMEQDRMKFVPMVRQAYAQKSMRRQASQRIKQLKSVSAIQKIGNFVRANPNSPSRGGASRGPGLDRRPSGNKDTAATPTAGNVPQTPTMANVPQTPTDVNSSTDFSRGFKLLIRAMGLPPDMRDVALSGV